MQLDSFKEGFEKLSCLLEGKINLCFFQFFSPDSKDKTEVPEEAYAHYRFIEFYKSAQRSLDDLFLKVHTIYNFVVDDSPEEEKKEDIGEFKSELFRSLYSLERGIFRIGSDLLFIYNKLTGDYPERCENNFKKESVDGYTQFIINELDFLVDVTDQINQYLETCGECSKDPCCCEATCAPSTSASSSYYGRR